MDFFTYTLPNGIRCIHRRIKGPVAHCALTVNAGSRDELPHEQGVAHFMEHCLFKGTEHRRAHHINCRLENLGGELNAFTTKEETVIHATTLRGDFAKAAELIADVVFHPTFPARHVETEKAVILDEINSYKDIPNERIWDEFEDLLFAGSGLGHNILGTRSSLLRQDRDTIRGFARRTYTTDQMVFSSTGNFAESTFRKVAEKYFGQAEASSRAFSRTAPAANEPFAKTLNLRNHQAHCIIGARAYTAYDVQRTHLSLLVNILGGPAANSLLNIALRERNGLTYNIEASYTPFGDTGLAAIYFSSEKENYGRCMEIISRQLDRIKTTPLTDRALSMAKKQFAGQLAISMESNEGTMLGAGKSFLLYNEVESMRSIHQKINAITAAQLMEAANDIFTDCSTLLYR